MTAAELARLRAEPEFPVTDSFLQDFSRSEISGVIAYVEEQPAGMLFLIPGKVAARHNTAGSVFTGIAVELPQGVYFLCKVFVREVMRGRRINAAMLDFAMRGTLQPPIQAIVTTTAWTNHSFLKSVESLGFQRCAMASEFVLAGRHFYRLPGPFDPLHEQALSLDTARDHVRFIVDD